MRFTQGSTPSATTSCSSTRPRPGTPPTAGDLARRICERHTGVGADGCIFSVGLREGRAGRGFRVFNADGGEAEISGNGLRCAAA